MQGVEPVVVYDRPVGKEIEDRYCDRGVYVGAFLRQGVDLDDICSEGVEGLAGVLQVHRAVPLQERQVEAVCQQERGQDRAEYDEPPEPGIPDAAEPVGGRQGQHGKEGNDVAEQRDPGYDEYERQVTNDRVTGVPPPCGDVDRVCGREGDERMALEQEGRREGLGPLVEDGHLVAGQYAELAGDDVVLQCNRRSRKGRCNQPDCSPPAEHSLAARLQVDREYDRQDGEHGPGGVLGEHCEKYRDR